MQTKGFTLIETIIVVTIFSVLIFLVSSALIDIFSNSNQEMVSLESIDQARLTLAVFGNEIRNALSGSDGSYVLNKTGDYELTFFSNYKIANNAVARIRYFVSNNDCDEVVPSGNTLCKGIVLPSGTPAVYNLSLEKITTAIAKIATPSSPVFYYYDSSYDGLTNALLQPVNINQVRYVKTSVSVLNQLVPNSTSAFIISAGATTRSIKDNLGN